MSTTVDLLPFDYDGQTIRTVQVAGEPWFVLADLCTVLGLTRSASAVAHRLDDGVRQPYPITDSFGRRQSVTIVSEAGMYEVVIRSDKPEAAAFRRWITGTVLPQIRKTGSFTTTTTAAIADISTPAGVLVMAEQFAATARQLVAATEQIAELAPKAELADTYLASDGGDRLIGQVAKLLGLKEKDLRRFLIEDALIFVRHTECGTPQYEPYAEFAPHFAVHETVVSHTWGNCSHFTLRVKPRGLDLIRRRLAKAGLVSIGAAS